MTARCEMGKTHKHAKYEKTQHRHDRLQIQQKSNTEAQSTELILTVFHVFESAKSHYHISPTILH
jgi:ribosomal protein S17